MQIPQARRGLLNAKIENVVQFVFIWIVTEISAGKKKFDTITQPLLLNHYGITGFRPQRCYGEVKNLYDMNRRLTGLNRAGQRDFFNIIEEPKLRIALNNDDDSPILDWAFVPILHIVRKKYVKS